MSHLDSAIAFPHARQISDQLIVGGQPSPDNLKALADAGFDTIVNLRAASELAFDEGAAVQDAGMRYVPLEVSGPADVSFEMAERLDKALESSERAVVHCASSNRVGALFALRAAAAGETPERAIAVGQAHGLSSLRDRVASLIADA